MPIVDEHMLLDDNKDVADVLADFRAIKVCTLLYSPLKPCPTPYRVSLPPRLETESLERRVGALVVKLRLGIIIWLLHNLVEASFDLFRYLLLGDQLKPPELHSLVSYTSCMNKNLL